MPVRLALVEDHPQLRRRLVERLRFFPDVELVLAAESGAAFLAALGDLEVLPEVVLMDIEMPGPDGISTTSRLKATHPEVEVLMLTVFEDEEKIFAAVQAGASGYLLKETSAEDIVAAVRALADGGAPMSPLVARKLLGYVRQQEATPRGDAAAEALGLTAREREVLERLVADETEEAIAERLFISPHTVRSHVKNLYEKLHVHSRAQAVRLAFERGLVR
ncbi:MAG TPA: response regulator transcription factor [Rubricoccaceae bacterium]|nr:response regulator transcription factor [Rubricoccaceae bacterium]